MANGRVLKRDERKKSMKAIVTKADIVRGLY
jgi:hypothetical protein